MAKGTGTRCISPLVFCFLSLFISSCTSAPPTPTDLERIHSLAVGDGETPLMVASESGSRRLVQQLLSAGAQVNAVDARGSTPVIRAARNGHVSVVKLLVAAGANVNVSQDGRSLLMHIVESGDMLTSERLLAAGADVNYRSGAGMTALDVARNNHNRDLEMLLIQAGARL